MSRVGVIAAALWLVGCDGPNAQATDENAVDSAPAAPSFRAIAGDDVFAMVTPADATAEQLVTAAREHCGRREFCRVHGWHSEGDAAKAMPMTDREVSTQAFQYAHNRSTGFEQRLWDCERWPRENLDECLAKE